ncbi:MAG: hypothetical protein EBQ97_00440 [Bacteroidetes bacterium]|nr:hypothetical protein [Bacteroidota bacterium]
MRFSINAIGYLFVAIFVILGALLLSVPIGHTGDGWGYAADIIQADSWQSPELVSSHHLFYNYLCYGLKPIFISSKINPINGFTAMNWMFYGLTIFVFYKVILALKYNQNQCIYWTLLIAGCFGLLRFSFENETYILPLFFALLGSHFITYFKNSKSHEYLGFSLLAISVLFHQSYIFWFLAFVVSGIYRRRFMAIFISAFMIVFFYILFAIKSNQSISSFILHDVDAGLVQVIPNINNLKFTLINGFRTIFQVHGNMLILIGNWTVLSLFGIGGALLFFHGLGISLKKQMRRFASKIKQLASLSYLSNRAKNPFFIAFFLQLAFAIYSVGNAEFMVMLPILFILSFHDKVIPIFTHIHQMALGLWIYNGVFLIVPTFMGSFDDVGLTRKMLSKERPTKPFVFISTQAIAIQNQMEYEDAAQKLNPSSQDKTTTADIINNMSDGQFIIGQNPNEILRVQDALNEENIEVYTDNSIIFNKMGDGSRAALLIDPKLKSELSNRTWQTVKEDSFSSPPRKIQLFRMVRRVYISH